MKDDFLEHTEEEMTPVEQAQHIVFGDGLCHRSSIYCNAKQCVFFKYCPEYSSFRRSVAIKILKDAGIPLSDPGQSLVSIW